MFHAQEFLIRLAEDKASIREIPNEAALIANPHASHAVSGDVDPATPGTLPAEGEPRTAEQKAASDKKSRTVKRSRERKKAAPTE